MVRFLHQLGANPNVEDAEHRTPLHLAAEHGYKAIAEILADRFKASLAQRTKYLERRAPGIKGVMSQAGQRTIHMAAARGYLDVVKLLLRRRERVDVKTRNGWTPLHFAASVPTGGKCTELLLKCGAIVNCLDNADMWRVKEGNTALHLGVRGCHQVVVKALIEYWATARPEEPLINRRNEVSPIRYLLVFGVLESRDSLYIGFTYNNKETPLHYCSRIGNYGVLEEIIKFLDPQDLQFVFNKQAKKMPGHRKRRQFKQTDAFTRGMVIGLKRAGWSIRQIAADTHLGASTVHRLWRRWLEQGNVAIYRNVGATRVTSARVDRRILRQAVAAP
ncbi:PPP1R12C [Cordylochernes scorpioides]|uniref:PPP1R12C n=1 Tax=Cordylochernes scorpioides TaxID=51811 RepID=A0ABY6KSN5_9ARAC|nr:PPP1R12C [Cordylochernes scorpioides]